MNKKWFTQPDKRPFLILIAIIVLVTVVVSAYLGRTPADILAYLGFVAGITYIVFS